MPTDVKHRLASAILGKVPVSPTPVSGGFHPPPTQTAVLEGRTSSPCSHTRPQAQRTLDKQPMSKQNFKFNLLQVVKSEQLCAHLDVLLIIVLKQKP